jgi:hypothetical protein
MKRVLYAFQTSLVRRREANGRSRGNQMLDWTPPGKPIVRANGNYMVQRS